MQPAFLAFGRVVTIYICAQFSRFARKLSTKNDEVPGCRRRIACEAGDRASHPNHSRAQAPAPAHGCQKAARSRHTCARVSLTNMVTNAIFCSIVMFCELF